MNGATHIALRPKGAWYDLDIREHDGAFLLQLWAMVHAVAPELCAEPSADRTPLAGHTRCDHKGSRQLANCDDTCLSG